MFLSDTYRVAAQHAAFDRETSGLATKVAVYAFCDPRSIAVAVHLHVF